MKIFSIKVLRFTIKSDRSVDLMRPSNTAQKNRCPEEELFQKHHMAQSSFQQNLKTNVAKYFFKLLKKHFGKSHKYHKIFNKNNKKVSRIERST